MQTLTLTSLLVASALAASFPQAALDQCTSGSSSQLNACVKGVADKFVADIVADEKAKADAVTKAQLSAALAVVKQKAAGLQAALNSKKKRGGNVASNALAITKAWCEGEFSGQLARLVGADQCKKLCAQFKDPNVIDASSSSSAFECLIPLTAEAVDKAANDKERDAAIENKRAATLLFVSTKFESTNNGQNGVLVANSGADIRDFAQPAKDLAFNADALAAVNTGKELAQSLVDARAVADNAAAPAAARATTLLFIQNLQAAPQFAGNAATDAVPAANNFAGAADQVFKTADANALLVNAPQEVVFTDLGDLNDAAVPIANNDFALFVGSNNALITGAKKRQANNGGKKEIAFFSENADEKLAHNLALVSFCNIKALKCKPSKAIGVSKDEFVEQKVETIVEEKARKLKEATKAPVKPPVKNDGGNGGNYNAPQAPHAGAPQRDNSASTAFIAAGALLSAIAMLI